MARVVSPDALLRKHGNHPEPPLVAQMRKAISEGAVPRGHPFPKFDHFTLTHHVSRDTVTRSFALLAAEGLVHKQGRKWICGPAPSRSPGGTSGLLPGREGQPVILLLTTSLRFIGNFNLSDRTYPFMNSFYGETESASALVRLVLTESGGAGVPFPSGEEDIRKLIRSLGKRYLGTLIIGKTFGFHEARRWSAFLLRYRKPVVLLDYLGALSELDRRRLGDNRLFHRAYFDETGATELAVSLLEELGHRRVVFPNFREEYRDWVAARLSLLETAAAKKNKLHVLDANLPNPDASPVSSSSRSLRALQSSYLEFIRFPLTSSEKILRPFLEKAKTTAILAPNDFLAIEYYLWLQSQHIRLPRDLSLLSFDHYADARLLPISTLDFGFGRLGYQVAHLLLGDLPVKVGRHGLMPSPARFVDRGSLGRAKPGD